MVRAFGSSLAAAPRAVTGNNCSTTDDVPDVGGAPVPVVGAPGVGASGFVPVVCVHGTGAGGNAPGVIVAWACTFLV